MNDIGYKVAKIAGGYSQNWHGMYNGGWCWVKSPHHALIQRKNELLYQRTHDDLTILLLNSLYLQSATIFLK